MNDLLGFNQWQIQILGVDWIEWTMGQSLCVDRSWASWLVEIGPEEVSPSDDYCEDMTRNTPEG